MKKIVYIAVAAATLVGCNKENNETLTSDKRAVEFTNGVITRASGTEWAAGDKIGIYMFGAGTTTVSEEKGNIEYYNSKAEDGTSATFDVVEADEIIYYPQGDVSVDFLAYYPFSSTKVAANDFIYEVNVNSENQADQTLIDLMVSNNLVGKTISSSALSMEFVHALSQLNFVVSSGTGSPSLDGLTITIGGFVNDAEYDLSTQVITLGDEATELVVVNNSAIIIPQTADLTFTFATTDNPTGFTTSKTMEFNAGESTTLTFVLNRTSVSLEGESTITGWTQIDGGTTQVN